MLPGHVEGPICSNKKLIIVEKVSDTPDAYAYERKIQRIRHVNGS